MDKVKKHVGKQVTVQLDSRYGNGKAQGKLVSISQNWDCTIEQVTHDNRKQTANLNGRFVLAVELTE